MTWSARHALNRPCQRGTAGAAVLLAALAVLTAAPSVHAQQPPPQGPTVTAADGTVETIDAIDPASRTAGLLALYTPAFGDSTGTNAFGAEAVLQETPTRGAYRVLDVCTVFDGCPHPGDNPIPDDGAVLSAAPGGDPDVRRFIADHVAVGDVVTVDVPVLRQASATLDATDPTAQTNPDGVDPSTGACYPGCRGAAQLIRYTPAFGERTQTNGFGSEITVARGRVSSRGGNDRVIPADGYVLSGHTSEGDWLIANSIEGALVTVDGDLVTITIDAEAYLVTAQRALDRAVAGAGEAAASCLDVDGAQAQVSIVTATEALDEAREATAAGEDERAVELATAAQAEADRAWYATRTSRPVESRGTWVRPTEHSRAEVAATLDRIAAAGLNTVFLETFFQGYTIFPSDAAAAAGVAAQRPEFEGFDPLQAFIEEGAARDIEIHPWIHTFFVGSDAANGGPGPVLSVHPEWAAVERADLVDGRAPATPQPSSAEPGYYFLDPAIPEARAYVQGILSELVADYEVAGLHLDYIRYPVSLPLEASFSYSDVSRARFAEVAGVDPATITPDSDPASWAAFDDWRRGNVTSFVAETRAILAQTRQEAVLSAAVFPDPFDSRVRKLQDWAAWNEHGLVDVLTGMSFGRSVETAGADTASMLAQLSDRTLLYTASYAPFANLPPDLLVDQVAAIRDAGGQGEAVFAYNQLTDSQAEALRRGPFRDPAATAHAAPAEAVATGTGDLAARVEQAHVPGGCVSPRAGRALLRDLDGAARAARQAAGDLPEPARLRAIDRAQRHLAGAQAQLDADAVEAGLAARMAAEIDQYRALLRFARSR